MDEEILTILADGEFHSGDELGQRLGISRAAVWKRLQKLQALDLPLVSIKGKGYQLEGGLNLLNSDQVITGLDGRTEAMITQLESFPVVGSTNSVALEKAQTFGSGYVCIAEQQTEGRGRRGRKWVSPFASSLYLSVVWEFAGGAAALEGLSLAVGVAVVSAFETMGLSGVRLKWPNDVLFENRKLAGILIEMVGDASGACQVVVGIGINVALPAQSAGAIDQPYIDLQEISGEKVCRNALLAQVLNQLMPVLADYETSRFAAYRDRWQALDAFNGQEVFLQLGDNMEFGIAAGVDDSGALILRTPTGHKLFSGGEVSLRRL